MSLRGLARQIANARKAVAGRERTTHIFFSPAEWIVQFEEWQKGGRFNTEPDFPKALAFYREALAQARAADPSIASRIQGDPQARGEPAILECLRIGQRFPDVPAAYEWLREILWRIQHEIPPVTEAEFAELAAWFAANEEKLHSLADSSSLFDVGRGRKTCCWYIRGAVRAGPRAEGAGEYAEDIRQLRSRWASRMS